MGLEDFARQKEQGSISYREEDHIDRLVSEIQNTTRVGGRFAYLTKLRCAMQIAQLEYWVTLDYDYGPTEADIACEYVGPEEEVEYNTMAVHVGSLDASDLIKAIHQFDAVLRVPSKGSLDEALIADKHDTMSEVKSVKSDEVLSRLSSDIYINSEGELFMPQIDTIQIKRYTELASDILSSVNDVSNMSEQEIVDHVNENTPEEYKSEDILKVCETLGYM